MGWKDVPMDVVTNNRLWVNEGLPNERNSIPIVRGFHVNIPTINGGLGTILNYDNTIDSKLNDGILTADLIYSETQPYALTATGDSIGIELSTISSINEIELYVNGGTDFIVLSNTLHILISDDGITWTRLESIETSSISYINETDYGVFNIVLSQPVSTQFISIRASSTVYLYSSGNVLLRAREFRVFTPSDVGINGDTYIVRNTGDVYEKVNNLWSKVYTAPMIPVHITGESITPPSGIGLPIGSLYIAVPAE